MINQPSINVEEVDPNFDSCFSFCNAFSREASNNLAQPMKANTFERALVEAFANRFPSRATAHQCAQMSVSGSSQSGSSNQELGSQAAWCVAQEYGSSEYRWSSLIRFKTVQKTGCLNIQRIAHGKPSSLYVATNFWHLALVLNTSRAGVVPVFQ